MNSPNVVTIERRRRRVSRAIAASRRLRDAAAERRGTDRGNGRVWVNGGELGGARAALAHLGESYD